MNNAFHVDQRRLAGAITADLGAEAVLPTLMRTEVVVRDGLGLRRGPELDCRRAESTP